MPPAIANTKQIITADNPNLSYVSEADYWENYYEEADIHYEWNNGYLEEKPMSDYWTIQTYLWFIDLLRRFLAVRPIADLTAIEMGFRMQLPNKTVIRKPDLGVIRRDNPIRPKGNIYEGIFDLCIEALSDSNTANRRRDEVTKKAEYAAGGIPEFFILHHNRRYQAFYTLSEHGIYTPILPQDGVINSLILPGFRFRTTDLGRCPDIDSLRTDPVYQHFVATGWQNAEARAEAEWERAEDEKERAEDQQRRAEVEWNRAEAERRLAEVERQRAEAERQRAEAEAQARQASEYRAERLAAQLRALGIDPDTFN